MYRLLFFTLLTPYLWANPNEMLSDRELEKKFVSLIKENEIDNLIKKTTDFNECRKNNKYVESDDEAIRKEKALAAKKCFQDKLSGKSSKDLQKLSDNLGLESYQLVKSKNVKDITSYLGKRMYKALTGISEEDQENQIKMANLKFKDRKLVDQEEYFRLYSYQLTKNALLEVSRFCFRNFENQTPPGNHPTSNFTEHWASYFKNPKDPNLSVSDTANHKWVEDFSESTEPSAAYDKIFAGMGKIDPIKLGQFWTFCSEQMKKMCDNFNAGDSKSDLSRGANSCLTINRLRSIRNAITATEETQKYMSENMRGGMKVGLDGGASATFFRADAGNNTSYDDLTNISSVEFLEKPDSSYLTLIEQCKKTPESADCDKFIAEGSTSQEELLHKIDQEMMIKQEVEIARILKIKEDNKIPFKEFLEKNGYFELAQMENPDKTAIQEFLAKNFEAQREAVTKKLKESVGSRQVVSDSDDKTNKTSAIKASAQEAENERARLSQVILFNNIVTANLSLFDSNQNELGKNVGGWKREAEALANANIDQNLYSNIQGVIDTSGGTGKNNSITGTEFIDMIIGKKTETDKSK